MSIEGIETVQMAPESTQEAPEASAENTQVEDTGANTEEVDTFSSRFAALSKREKMLRSKETEWKDKASQYDKYSSQKDSFKSDPMKILEHYGISLDDLIISSMGEDAPAPTPESEIAALRRELDEYKTGQITKEEDAVKATKDAKTAQEQKLIQEYKDSISQVISQNADEFELVAMLGYEDTVFEVVENHYTTTGEVLDPKIAAQHVEDYLMKNMTNSKKFSKVEKELEKVAGQLSVEDRSSPYSASKPTLTQDYASTAPAKRTEYSNNEDSLSSAAKLLQWD